MLKGITKLIAVGAAAGAMLVSAGEAGAVDANGDGYHDALLREQPYLPYANVGARCDIYRLPNGAWRSKQTVRSPRVWGMWAAAHSVAWRARFYDVNSGVTVAQGNWEYRTIAAGQYTDFGGGPNAPGVMITWAQYWQGGQYWDHPAQETLKSVVDVAWLNPYTNQWVVRELPVLYVLVSGLAQRMSSITGC
jgi:hypothetical protein